MADGFRNKIEKLNGKRVEVMIPTQKASVEELTEILKNGKKK